MLWYHTLLDYETRDVFVSVKCTAVCDEATLVSNKKICQLHGIISEQI